MEKDNKQPEIVRGKKQATTIKLEIPMELFPQFFDFFERVQLSGKEAEVYVYLKNIIMEGGKRNGE